MRIPAPTSKPHVHARLETQNVRDGALGKTYDTNWKQKQKKGRVTVPSRTLPEEQPEHLTTLETTHITNSRNPGETGPHLGAARHNSQRNRFSFGVYT